jgi:hypothetical protein
MQLWRPRPGQGARPVIGTKRQNRGLDADGRFRGKADVNERAASTASVVDDPNPCRFRKLDSSVSMV